MTGSMARRGARALLAAAALALGGASVASDSGPPIAPPRPSAGNVVLLHGLARGGASMARVAGALRAAGYRVCTVDYPSRRYPVEELAARHVAPAVAACFPGDAGTVHFVTHSLGGIVVRSLARGRPPFAIGRVVMLGPPNRGSEAVDALGERWLFRLLNGPAGGQLGTGADDLPARLGPVPFELGVIAGTRSVNGGLSLLIPGPDDGKVAVCRAAVDGMADFVALAASHTFMMWDGDVLRQTIHFLDHGAFAGRS